MAERRGLDVTTPNVARIYDYWLGGKDNFAADRVAAEKINEFVPEAPYAARASREFLGRAVRFLARAGIRQFIDLGTGLPTQANVHEVAQQIDPAARVAYVDYDPVVITHARALLDRDTVTIIEADIRDTEQIVGHPDLRALIDFDEPVGVLMVSILHYITEAEDPYRIVTEFRDAIVPGSHLAICHVTAEPRPEAEAPVTAVYCQATAPMVPRDHGQVLRFFDGFDLVEPGVVYTPEWRPNVVGERTDPKAAFTFAGVGGKKSAAAAPFACAYRA
jgi:hypothetical protein